ncbi:MAG: O-antigen ligase family protein [Cyanobacteria bacterium P01_D01_bin.56]
MAATATNLTPPLMTKVLYTVLFTLLVVIHNPFSSTVFGVWGTPKLICLITICIANAIILFSTEETIESHDIWLWIGWGGLLISGLVSTLTSPLPSISLLGVGANRDGLAYWCLVAIFCITNRAVLTHQPSLLKWQLMGFLTGATMSSAAVLAQVIVPVDYTAYRLGGNEFQPMGLFSHRAYTAFISSLSLIGLNIAWCRHWGNRPALKLMALITILALLVSNTRGAILAAVIGATWIGTRQPRPKRWIFIGLTVVALSTVLYTSSLRKVDVEQYTKSSLELFARNLTSDRLHLWQRAYKSIPIRPLYGWGFNGLAIADAVKVCAPHRAVALIEYQAVCSNEEQIYEDNYVNAKAHNIIVDDLISTGAVGLLAKCILLTIYASIYRRSINSQAAILTYVTFLMLWFDHVQLTHLAWWLVTVADIDSS